jgi:hypothetical protein
MLTDSASHIITTAHHNVSAKRCNEFVIGLGSIGNDPQPLVLRQLDHVAAVGARGTGHRECLAR